MELKRIKSEFVRNILTLLFDEVGEDDGNMKNLNYLIDSKYEYTGQGVFVSFSYEMGVENYQLKSNGIYNGVVIESTDFEGEAEAIAFTKDRMVNYLEIWSYNGSYPKKELSSYVITQRCEGSPGRSLSKPR